ncbi:hypothetical protein [Kushneria phosphatilytica]|uniref:Uncharacterized protein n=1 Tax=Kushneria phosphatilytica TaxID=657387 RepID=A0A1S1NXY4_9GAMM|nr:hypothetical protein [Kushneria phosphatilytica]OHV12297.1 hypothetical protein BH688_06660 [Kushneria phosphatilytica]QEL11502.1 hypothetical protein FY550_10395 [Kushneria phosphatilytica]
MTKATFRTLAIALGVSSTALTAPYAFAESSSEQQTIQQLRQQLEQMQARLERLENQQAQSSGNAGTTGQGETAPGKSAESQQYSSAQQNLAEKNSSILEQMQQTQISGTFELAHSYNDWDEQDKDTGGDIDFGKFILGIDGQVDNYIYSFQYRFYDGYRFLHHGWLGYQLNDNDTVKVGLVQTPFGNMDYGYLGWYGTLPYLAGFNDNQNAGIKWHHEDGPWTTDLAFFKSDQLGSTNESYGANPPGGTTAATYDDNGDLDTRGDQGNKSENQVAARVGYTFGHGTDYTTEVNFSAKGGQLYNEQTNDSGDNWAAALGLNGNYGNWSVLLQATQYEYNAKNADEDDTGISDNVMQVGAFNFNYLIPAEGQMYNFSLAYSMDVNWGPIDNAYFYNDYSYISADGDYSPINGGFGSMNDPQLNDIGIKLTAGPYYAWFDIVTNKNGLNYFGSPVDDDWHTSYQTHFGVNF